MVAIVFSRIRTLDVMFYELFLLRFHYIIFADWVNGCTSYVHIMLLDRADLAQYILFTTLKMNWNDCLSHINSLHSSMLRLLLPILTCNVQSNSRQINDKSEDTSEPVRSASNSDWVFTEHNLHWHLWFLLHCWRRNYYVIDFAWSEHLYFRAFSTHQI